MSKYCCALLILFIIACQAEQVIAEGYLEISGTARHNSQPVVGATATLYLTGTTGAELSSINTGANGTFSFDLDFGKMYRIVLKKTGYTEMTLLINAVVPPAEKGYVMSYAITFDIFKHKEGYETKMSSLPLIKIAYIARKENFGSKKQYSNSATYVRIIEDEKAISVSEDIKTEEKEEQKEADKTGEDIITKAPATEEEKRFIEETKEQVKHAEFKEEIAESAANQSYAVEVATKRVVKSIEQKRIEEIKASKLKESLVREQDQARKEVVKNRSARSNAQKSLMSEIAEMMRDEKQKNP